MLYAMLKSHKTGDVNNDCAVDAIDASEALAIYTENAAK